MNLINNAITCLKMVKSIARYTQLRYNDRNKQLKEASRMKRTISKATSLLLALIMVLGLVPVASAASEVPEGAPVIVIYQNSGAGNGAGSEAGSTEAGYKMVQQYIYEQTGVWVEAIKAPATNAEEKLNMMLAGNEQIDLFWGDWRNYYDTGMIQPWNDYMAEWPLIYDTWASWDAWPGVTDAEGNYWGMPRMTPTTPYQMFFRAEWLDKLNMDIPNTLEEVEEYLYAVKENDLAGNGNTIPLVCNQLSRLEYCFVAGFVKDGNGKWLDATDNKVKPVYLAEGYTDFLALMQKWYNDGIIHKEAFSWDTNTLRNYIAQGVAGATATWYSDITTRDEVTNTNLMAADPNYDMEKYPYAYIINENGITGPNGNYIETRANAGSSCLMLSSRCENPEAAMKLINWQYESWENYQTATFGLKDYHWRYDPEDPDAETVTYKNIGWTDENGQTMYKTVDGELSYDNTIAYFADFTTSIGLPTEVLGTSFILGRQQQHSLWLQSHLDDFDVTMEPGCEYGITWNTVELRDNAPMSADIETYVSEQIPKFIIGERNLNDWDAFIQELYQMGLQSVIDEYTRQYELLKQ